MERKPEPSGLAAINTIGYIIVLCDDIGSMRDFYANVLRLPIQDEEPDHWVSFRVGSVLLGLRPRGRVYDGPDIPYDSASIQLSFRVAPADVDLAWSSLQNDDVGAIEGPTNQDFPHRTMFIRPGEQHHRDLRRDPSSRLFRCLFGAPPKRSIAAPNKCSVWKRKQAGRRTTVVRSNVMCQAMADLGPTQIAA